MTTLTSPTYATPETLIYQSYKKQHDRKRRKSHNPSFIVSYPYVTNYMPSPFDPEGWFGATSDTDGTITNIALNNPSGAEFIGLAEQTGAGSFIPLSNFPTPISSVTIGEKLYMGMIFKIANFPAKIQTYIAGIGGSGNLTLDLQNKTALTMPANWNYKFTELTDGFFLVETEFVSQASGSNVYQDVILREGLGTIPPIGSQLYVQAAFFGKADDFPANVMPTL